MKDKYIYCIYVIETNGLKKADHVTMIDMKSLLNHRSEYSSCTGVKHDSSSQITYVWLVLFYFFTQIRPLNGIGLDGGCGLTVQHECLWLVPSWLADWLTASGSWLKAATLFRISFSLPRSGISDMLPWPVSGSVRHARVRWNPSWGQTLPSYCNREGKGTNKDMETGINKRRHYAETAWHKGKNHVPRWLNHPAEGHVIQRRSQSLMLLFAPWTTQCSNRSMNFKLVQIFFFKAVCVRENTHLNTKKRGAPLPHFCLGLTAEIPANKWMVITWATVSWWAAASGDGEQGW